MLEDRILGLWFLRREELEDVRSELGLDLAFFLKSNAIDGISFSLSLRKPCIYY